MDKHLIIFVNPPPKNQLGIGQHKNKLKAYLNCMENTAAITADISASKHIYYHSFIENDSVFSDHLFQKKIHQKKLPKDQLTDALKESFGQWAKKVVFVATDFEGITTDDIEIIYEKLENSDFVILPSASKGVLLFGTTFFNSDLLNHFPWETNDDLLDTIISLQESKKTYCVLAAKD